MSTQANLREAFFEAAVAGPADEHSIALAEKTLGTVFPPEYRTFLTTYGAVLGQGYEIAGLFQSEDKPPMWTDVARFNVQKRRISRDALPNYMIAIADDGADCVFYLDASRLDEEGRCLVLKVGPGSDMAVVANSFTEFATNLVRHSRMNSSSPQ